MKKSKTIWHRMMHLPRRPLESWKSVKDELGAYSSIVSQDVEKDGDSCYRSQPLLSLKKQKQMLSLTAGFEVSRCTPA